MLDDQGWQHSLLDDLSAGLRTLEGVKALVLTGSLADDALTSDEWSDIDLTAIVADDAIDDLCSQLSWLQRHGEVLGLERHHKPEAMTLRVCFAPCKRVDISLVPESVLGRATARRDAAPCRAHVLLWSKTPEADQFLPRLFPKPAFDGISERSVVGISKTFWFKASIAMAKTVRNDLLVALHLALDLVRDCLVLQMIRRDRELGTDVHRVGGFGNDIVSRLYQTVGGASPLEILRIVRRSTLVADELLSDLLPSYTPRAASFFPALRRTELECGTRIESTKRGEQSPTGDVLKAAPEECR